MHFGNDILQAWLSPITTKQLGEIHAAKLEEGVKDIDQPKNPRGKIIGVQAGAKKIEQVESDLSQNREALLSKQNAEFASLLDSLREARGSTDPRKIESLEPLSSRCLPPSKEVSFQTYFDFAANPKNTRKIIINIAKDKILTGDCVLSKQKGDDYFAVIGDDHTSFHFFSEEQQEITKGFLNALKKQYGTKAVESCFSQKDQEAILHHGLTGGRMLDLLYRLEHFPVNQLYKRTKELKGEVAILSSQAMGPQEGLKNKKFSDQAKFLKEKAKALRKEILPFQSHSDEDIRHNASYITHQLNLAIDELTEIFDEAQRHRKIIDGLDLRTKPWHGKPLSVEEGEAIIGNQDASLTSRDVDESPLEEEDAPKHLHSSDDRTRKIEFDYSANESDDETGTDVETDSTISEESKIAPENNSSSQPTRSFLDPSQARH